MASARAPSPHALGCRRAHARPSQHGLRRVCHASPGTLDGLALLAQLTHSRQEKGAELQACRNVCCCALRHHMRSLGCACITCSGRRRLLGPPRPHDAAVGPRAGAPRAPVRAQRALDGPRRAISAGPPLPLPRSAVPRLCCLCTSLHSRLLGCGAKMRTSVSPAAIAGRLPASGTALHR